ncbi:MAG: Npt1/Npt2 family nucleotide transporter [Gammaproteobacteria bacterium]|nr:Npt1/Npt2 family nucleotide transporter [Gammaproteobacteria bacterium]MDE0454580.1 Npt1/Npt2 family nucleotide transporter [Gammaproteobacteria bacterium]
MTDWAARVLNFKRGELRLALLAALFNFCVLCGYFFLRPVRETMGVARGMDELRWLFVVTSISSLVFVLLFAGVVARMDRRRFIPVGYGFVVVCLLGFAALLFANAQAGGGLIGSDTETPLARGVGYTFYVWLSTINLFSTSLFWAFMADIFNMDQGKRMFAFIGAGGTLGAAVGGWAAYFISNSTESDYLPMALMLTGAGLFVLATVLMLKLDRTAVQSSHSRLGETSGPPVSIPGQRIGGGFFDGLTAVGTSPYLMGIALFIVCMAVSNTLIYFTQANIVLIDNDTFSERLGAFALFDALAQTLTLLTQIFIATRVIRRLGVGWTLAILPLVTLAGFAVLAIWPLYGVMAIFQAVHRTTRYALSRPARETLFIVVPPAERYKAKPLIDVFLYRGGDLAGAGIHALLSGLGSLGVMVAAVTPFAAVWTALSVALGRAQTRRDPANQPDSVELPAGSSAESVG